MKKLDGKIVLIAGGTSGIGAATANARLSRRSVSRNVS